MTTPAPPPQPSGPPPSTPPAPPTPTRDDTGTARERSAGRFQNAPAWISAFTGLGGLLLGFLGLPVFLNSPTANPRALPPSPVASAPTGHPATTTTAPPPASTPPASRPPAPSPSSGGPPVFTSTSVDVPSDYSITLTDRPVRPRERSSLDLKVARNEGFEFYAGEKVELVVLKKGETGTYDTCRTVTRFTGHIPSDPAIRPGFRFCALTERGATALVEVEAVDPDEQFIRLRLTVWEDDV